jgi:hypothetical protein
VLTKLLSNWPEEGASLDQKVAALRFFIRGLRSVEYEQNIEESLLSMDALFHGSTNSELDLHLL